MDTSTHKKNWYFFRQRIKKKKQVLRETQRMAFQTNQHCESFRLRFNSTTQSLLQSLTQISQLQNTITHFIQIQNVLYQQISNSKNRIQNLQSQISLYKARPKSQPKRRKVKMDSSDEYVSIEDSEDSEDEFNTDRPRRVKLMCSIKRIYFPKPSIIPIEVKRVKKLISST
eukprot:TRINITY_DN788_c0_g1_i1.p1 TRINITY_DN788_c0_g1~~TRINITY_DN788_c0_g1_i1.p1  ORF type:complete len:187 (+),score=22.82 TRINITY_DN788_c0_g1_i1:51-563(+)